MFRRKPSAMFLLAFFGTILVFWPAGAFAQQAGLLRYRGEQGQTYAYDVKITADTDDAIEDYKGVIAYTFHSVTADQLKVSYRGGLNKTQKPKPSSNAGGFPPFGPFGPRFGPPMPFGPFGGNPFRGLVQTTNELTLTPQGRIQNMKGDSQLPFLLGNLSLLVFEPLPDAAQASWTVNLGVAITDEGGQGDHPFFGPRGRFGPFGPFGDNRPEERTAASEVLTFATERVAGDSVVLKRTYRLNSPVTDKNEESFTIDGSGTWTFDRKRGISESLDFKQNLAVRKGNSSTTIPLSISYRLLSSQEWEKIEQERLAAEKKAREELERKTAEKKAAAESPIEGDQRREVLAALNSGNVPKLESTLKMLSEKTERDDAEIAGAVEPLLRHPVASVREKAQAAFARFSPSYKRKYELNRAYNDRNAVEPGPPVLDDTPLPPGLIVASLWHGQWRAAKVIQVLDDGQVEIQFQKWPWKDKRSRADIRLAPPEVDQPDVDPSMVPKATPATSTGAVATAGTAYRTWTDDSGTFSIEAKYVGDQGQSVRLLRKDGKEVQVPLSRLSEADRNFVEQQRRAPKPTNPFE